MTNPVYAKSIECTKHEMIVRLSDGRSLSVPIAWFPRLAQATPSERADFKLLGGGEGIHWPQLDEDVSVLELLAGRLSVDFGRDI